MPLDAARSATEWSHGTLVTWDDNRGFGFIRPSAGGRDVFVHVRELTGSPFLPAVGQTFTYETMRQPDGRDRAVRVLLAEGPGAGRSASPRATPARSTTPRSARPPANRTPRTLRVVVPLVLGAAVVVALDMVWGVPSWAGWVYATMSLLTFAVYAKDKSAAQAGRWRVAESTLHLLALAGGWPGALLAQQVLRHKTIKVSFRTAFWCTVVANLVLLAALSSPAAAALG